MFVDSWYPSVMRGQFAGCMAQWCKSWLLERYQEHTLFNTIITHQQTRFRSIDCQPKKLISPLWDWCFGYSFRRKPCKDSARIHCSMRTCGSDNRNFHRVVMCIGTPLNSNISFLVQLFKWREGSRIREHQAVTVHAVFGCTLHRPEMPFDSC